MNDVKGFTATKRVYNFSPGPAMLSREVLERAREDRKSTRLNSSH